MITDDALRAAAKEASLALAEALTQGSKQQPPYVPSKSCTSRDVGTGQQATAALQPQQVLYTQNEPSVPP